MSTTSKLLIFALIFVPAFTFVGLFGSFTPFDDEGYSIGVIRNIAEGVPLYTGQFDFHGPAPFLAKALILRALGIQITHETLRFWVLAIWLVSCGLLSSAVWQITRNKLLSVCAVIITCAHLFPLRFNPGHPEDFVVLFLSLSIWIASKEAPWLSANLRVAALAAIGAILLETKINVGIFYLMGFALWILASVPRGRAWKPVALLFVAGATSLPTVLMRSFLVPSWQLLVISTLSIAITCAAFTRLQIPPSLTAKHIWISVTAVTFTVSAVVWVAMLCGSRPSDLLEQTVLAAAQHSGMLLRPVFTWVTIPVIPVFLWISMRQLMVLKQTGPPTQSPSLACMKVGLALTGLLLASFMFVSCYMPLIGPICWLLVFPDGRSLVADRASGGRLFVACIAVFDMLQVFPIRGAQTAWSTMPLCIGCLVLLFDAISELSRSSYGVPKVVRLSTKFVGAVALCAPAMFAINLWCSFVRSPSLAFAESIHVPMAQRAGFDWVVASLARYCDSLVTQPGLDSFLLWSSPSERKLQSPVLLVDWPLTMPGQQQLQSIAMLAKTSRSCAVYSQRLSEWWTNDVPQGQRADISRAPLVTYIQQLQPIGNAGDYQIRVNDLVAAKWSEDYLLNGTRDIDGTRNAIGVPIELLANGQAELNFDFQTSGPGPLVSVQCRNSAAGDESDATEPLCYISREGALIIRAKQGSYVSASPVASIDPGGWHHFSMARNQDAWNVMLDGVEVGIMGDFFTDFNHPLYLQLGPAYIENRPSLGSGWVRYFGKLRDARVKRGRTLLTANSGNRQTENPPERPQR